VTGTVADLHVHTTASDGRLGIGELPSAAREAGLSWVAVTDHDRVHPELERPIERRDGVAIVRGVELRVEVDARGRGIGGDPFRVDLLGYAVDPTDGLAAELDRIQRDRLERAREMVRLIEGETGAELDVTYEHGVGRPHVARAIAESDAPYDYAGAFEHLIGDGGPCYVPRDVPSFERGVALLSASCRLVVLAHPLRYDDPGRALALVGELDGAEREYPYDRPVDVGRVDGALADAGGIATGGSDAHDRTLGRAGLDRDGFAPVERRLTGEGDPRDGQA